MIFVFICARLHALLLYAGLLQLSGFKPFFLTHSLHDTLTHSLHDTLTHSLHEIDGTCLDTMDYLSGYPLPRLERLV